MTFIDDLRVDIQAGRVVVIVGAGVSVASSPCPAASWSGLLQSGIERALEVRPDLPEEWLDIVNKELERTSYSPGFVDVASKVASALGGKSGGEFAAWLRDQFDNMSITHPGLIDAIGDLGSPLLTTNYDHLLEHRLRRDAVTWQNPSALQQILMGRSNDIGHLHGSWKSPQSIIFSEGSYGELIGNEASQTLQQAIAATRTLLFVGFGEACPIPTLLSCGTGCAPSWGLRKPAITACVGHRIGRN